MTRLVAPLSAAERDGFIAAARSFLTSGKDGGRAEFGHRGRLPHKVDCVGLVALSLMAVGRDTADAGVYGREPEPEGLRLRSTLRDCFGDPVPLAYGCVVLMRWGSLPNHVGLIGAYPLGGLSLIHALAQDKRAVEHRLADPWPRRIVEAYAP